MARSPSYTCRECKHLCVEGPLTLHISMRSQAPLPCSERLESLRLEREAPRSQTGEMVGDYGQAMENPGLEAAEQT